MVTILGFLTMSLVDADTRTTHFGSLVHQYRRACGRPHSSLGEIFGDGPFKEGYRVPHEGWAVTQETVRDQGLSGEKSPWLKGSSPVFITGGVK